MWLLITSTGKLIYLKTNISVSIGRKKTDILLLHDASISKLHASIIVKPHKNVVVGKPASSCILKDEGSKYGTYISKNGTFQKVTTNIDLKDQDVIRIGLRGEIFTVTYIPIITMVSALQDNEKDKLLEIMGVIDGIITTDWNKYCTHLTVVKPKLTQKVAISLAAGIPIVSIDYWDAVRCIIEKGDPLPKTDNFIPEISEQYISKEIISLSPNYKRKMLFTNLTFNFFSLSQYRMYGTMIKLAGGESILFDLKNKQNNALNYNFIFVQYSSTNSTQFTQDFMWEYDNICKKLNTHKCRVIPESEIPLAILHCCTEQYCNPKYNFGNFLKRQEKANYNVSEILVLDTQDQDTLINKDIVGKQKSCCGKNKSDVEEILEKDDNASIQDNAMSQESSDSSKKLTPQIGHTASKKPFIPESIESSYNSQRNADSYIKHNVNCDPFKINTDNNLKDVYSSINVTHEEKRTTKLSDEHNNEQVARSYTEQVCPRAQVYIPKTIDINHTDSSKSSNKKSKSVDSFVIMHNFSKENDSNDVSILAIKKQPRKGDKDELITMQDISQTGATKSIKSHEKQRQADVEEVWITVDSSNVESFQEIDIGKDSSTSYIRIRKNPPGKTFQKAYVKIPEKRKLMDIIEEN